MTKSPTISIGFPLIRRVLEGISIELTEINNVSKSSGGFHPVKSAPWISLIASLILGFTFITLARRGSHYSSVGCNLLNPFGNTPDSYNATRISRRARAPCAMKKRGTGEI